MTTGTGCFGSTNNDVMDAMPAYRYSTRGSEAWMYEMFVDDCEETIA